MILALGIIGDMHIVPRKGAAARSQRRTVGYSVRSCTSPSILSIWLSLTFLPL